MFDFITVGSATQDIFIESNLGNILDMRNASSKSSYLCFEYGAKIEIDKLAFDVGGGAVNTAVNFANLGFKTATIVKMGQDLNAQAVITRLKERNVSSDLVIRTDNHKTGFSVILNSYEGDRTVLAHRGSNSTITRSEINWDLFKQSKWIYLAPMAGATNLLLNEISSFAEKNGISLAFNPGATQIKRGINELKKVFANLEVLVLNNTEASAITSIAETNQLIDIVENGGDIDFSKLHSIDTQPWVCSIYRMLMKLKSYGSKIVAITNGVKGVIAYDGKHFYLVPPFPAKVVSTLGAGDAFTGTFVAAIEKYGKDHIEKAIAMASINGAAVVENFGAQTGLKTFEELESIINYYPDYKVIKKERSEIEYLLLDSKFD